MVSRRKVFVTGIAGFLGSHLAESFLKLGYEVAGIDNLICGSEDNIPRGSLYRRADCNDIRSYIDLIHGSGLVYHCAATAYEGVSVFSPHFINTNVMNATSGVLSAAIQSGVKRFVHCSSMARYGANEIPYAEHMTPRPVDPYGVSKYASELMVINLCETHGLEFNIAIPHNIIGSRQKYDDPYRNVAAIFINRMLLGKQPIIYGDGLQKRCFSFIQDCLYCLKKLGVDPDIRNEIFNIGPDEEFISILDLAGIIAGLLDFKLEPIFIPEDRPQEVKYAFCSADKARKLLGYKTRFTLRQGLEQMIADIRLRGPRDFAYNLNFEIINERTPITWTNKLL
jgi:UDP-glucose 4-epimerase